MGLSLGPIPWNHILTYGQVKGLDHDNFTLLQTVIRAIDEAYLAWHAQNKDREGAEDALGSS